MTLLIWLLFVSYPLILSREVDGCFITIEGFAVTLFTSVCIYFYASLQWNVLSVKLIGKYLTPRSSEVFISFFVPVFPIYLDASLSIFSSSVYISLQKFSLSKILY